MGISIGISKQVSKSNNWLLPRNDNNLESTTSKGWFIIRAKFKDQDGIFCVFRKAKIGYQTHQVLVLVILVSYKMSFN